MPIHLHRNARAAITGAGVGLLLAGVISVAEAEISPPRLHTTAPMPALVVGTVVPPPGPVPAPMPADLAPNAATPNEPETDPATEVLVTPSPSAVAMEVAEAFATPTPTTTASEPPTPAADRAGPIAPVGRSVPVAIDIPAIGVHAAVNPMGLAPDGTLGVPPPGPHYGDTAWYDQYPTPGERGPAVITGHLDSAHDGPSVFYRLGALVPGDHVVITRADGSTVTFTVTGSGRYPQRAFPTDTVYGDLDYAGLRLITCGGDVDPHTHHYLDDVVVYATLTGATPPVEAD